MAILFSSVSFNVAIERLGVKLIEDPAASVSIKYLFLSLSIGYAIALWLFMEGTFSSIIPSLRDVSPVLSLSCPDQP